MALHGIPLSQIPLLERFRGMYRALEREVKSTLQIHLGDARQIARVRRKVIAFRGSIIQVSDSTSCSVHKRG